MFKNYLKITLRNLAKHKSFSFINIAGLSFGIACCLLITGYVMYELSFDKFHKKGNNIYRTAGFGEVAGTKMDFAASSALLGPMTVKNFGEVVNQVRMARRGKRMYAYENKQIDVQSNYYVDNSFFDIYSFNLIKGDPSTALKEINTLVVTEETARNFFGDDDPMGKVLMYNNTTPMTVVGVIENVPSNSHFTFDMLLSLEIIKKDNNQFVESVGSWLSFNYYTYLELGDNVDPQLVEDKINEFFLENFGEVLKQLGGNIEIVLQPMTDIHLHSNMEGELGANTDIKYIYSFAAIALFILLIACINYMNLSTARAANRAKEVGLRKVFGAVRSKLSGQFFMESMFYAVISVLLAVGLAELLLPAFNELAAKEIALNIGSPVMLIGLLVITLFIGFAAGSYPALLLSGFKPVAVLRGSVNQGAKNSTFRNILVSGQFIVSIFLIIGTIVVNNQLIFMKNKNLGFEKDQILTINMVDKEVRENWQSIKNEISQIPGVLNVTASTAVPGSGNDNSGFLPEGVTGTQMVIIENFDADADFVDTYSLKIVKGRNFSKEMGADSREGILINETLANKLGWIGGEDPSEPNSPIGKVLKRPMSQDLTELATFRVVGVFKDFHMQSLYEKISPGLIANKGSSYREDFYNISVKMDMQNVSSTLKGIETVWKKFDPDRPFTYSFLNEAFDSRYKAEERLGRIFNSFSVLAILIGCLGLFGLASFTAEQRTKEIGIRKVLGSNVSSIIIMLCKDFVKLVAIANIIAWPVAYYAMDSWLANFPYKIEFSVLPYVFAAFIAVAVAILTVSWQSFKAATKNPADSLHYE